MIERQASPQTKTITLEEYRGIGKDILELNAPVAGGFMKTADIRDNIVVVQKDPLEFNPREQDRLKRILNRKPEKVWQNKQVSEVRHDHETNTWYLGINDEILSKKIQEASTRITFEEQYVAAFQSEIVKSLRSILKREKLLNSEKYTPTFLTSYGSMGLSLGTFVIAETGLILSTQNLSDIAVGTLTGLALLAPWFVSTNLITNTMNYGFSWFKSRPELEKLTKHTRYSERESLDNPFIKNKLGEFLLPPVPIDKLIKGTLYLNKHQNELLNV